jgi:hypothetical protein
MTPHSDAATLDRYAAATLDPVRSTSVEEHLLTCAACRVALAERVSMTARPRLERMWDEVIDRMDAPRTGPVERALRAVGVPEHIGRLLAATPALHVPWLLSITALLSFAVVAAHASPRGIAVFLALAPLLPLAGVATAYGPGADPTYELGVAAPLSSFHLLLIRTAAALSTSVVLVGAAALALPGITWAAAAWLLPALALAMGSLALGAFVNPLWASGALGLGWLAVVATIASGRTPADAVLGQTAQAAWAVLAVVAVLVVVRRREAYEVAPEWDA